MATEPAKIQDIIRFGGDLEFHLRTYRLSRDGRVLKLERIPIEILLFLIEQKGLLVTREQIAERIWGKNVFLDTDNSINGAIRKIRRALKDDPEQPRFIQTITGKGYRFIALVDEAERQGEADARILPPGVETPAPLPSKRHSHLKSSSILAVGLVVFLLAAGLYFSGGFRPRPQPSGERLMLAVLPFQNLTGDAGQEYFTDGMTEEMITQLGNLDPQHLGVIARTSVMHYKNSSTPLEQIDRELRVQYVLEGSIRRNADKVRITAQLIQTRDQTHIWARQYDRELRDLLAVQGEIAQEIADEIQLALGDHKPSAVTAPTLSPRSYDAYDLYLKGQYFLNKRTAADLEEGIRYFQQAISKDPNYARAYAGLADCYVLTGGYSERIQTERMGNARAAALRALQIDQNLSEAHTALALIAQNYEWDWQTSEKEFRRAIELNPNYATAHHWVG